TQARELLQRGCDQGRFATHLPVPVLGTALQAVTLALLQAVNNGLWTDDGTQAATASLIAAGVPAADAAEAVRQARSLPHHPPAAGAARSGS
ncbi:MAG TPA: hypothetical protein VFO77_03965, partial [Actinoplanes sp.]|nr:hypothetical protein [Actinoplanes sp.]